MSGCSRHPSKEAIAACHNCGNFVCVACHKEIDGKSYCPVCVEKLFESTVIKSDQTPAPVPPAAKPAPLPAEKDKIGVAPVAKAAKAVEPTAAEKIRVTDTVSTGQERISWLWWIPPVVLGWIGGLISWLPNKESAPKTARNMLFGGIGMSVLQGIISLILIISLVPGSIPHTPQLPTTAQPKQSSPATTVKPPASTQNRGAKGNSAAYGTTAERNKTTPLPATEPSYKLTSLATQKLQPSGTDQTVSYENKVSVTIPGGGLKEPQSLTISAVTNPPPPNAHEEQLAVYDISFEKQHEFDSELTYRFSFNPADIPADKPLAMALAVDSLDPATQRWVPVQSQVDEANNQLIVHTQHNGLWQVVRTTGMQDVLLTEHFAIFYYPEDYWTPKVARYVFLWAKRQAWYKSGKTTEAPTSDEEKDRVALQNDPEVVARQALIDYEQQVPDKDKPFISDNPNIAPVVSDIAYYAERTWDKYKPFAREPYLQDFTLPTNYRIDITSEFHESQESTVGVTYPAYYTTEVKQRFPIYLNKGAGDPLYATSEKAIYMGYDGLADHLPETVGHELFHAIQHRDYNMLARQWGTLFTAGMSPILWWLEPTAEYAGWKIATAHDDKCSSYNIDANYLTVDFFSNDILTNIKGGAYIGDPEHRYRNAFFINYLVKHCDVNFVNMYNNVRGDSYPAETLNQYLMANARSPYFAEANLGNLYRQFAWYLLFADDSPCKSSLSTQSLPLNVRSQPYSFTQWKGLTANYIAIKPQIDTNKGSRTLKVILETPAFFFDVDYGVVDVFVIPNNKTYQVDDIAPVKEFYVDGDSSLPKEICEVTLNTDDQLFIVLTANNNLLLPFLVGFTIEGQSELTIQGPQLSTGAEGTMGEPYEFQAVGEGIPADAKYTWTVDGKDTGKRGKTLKWIFWHEGGHSVSAKAKWGTLFSKTVNSDNYIFQVGTPKMSISGPEEKGKKGGSYSFILDRKYIPKIAEYHWTIKDKAVDGDKDGMTHTFNEVGTYGIKAKAEWQVPEGDLRSVSALATFTVEAAAPSLKIIPPPTGLKGIQGEQYLFSVEPTNIPKEAIYTWYVDGSLIGPLDVKEKFKFPAVNARDYIIKVNAAWKANNIPENIWAEVKFTVEPVSLQIIAPAEITQGKGTVNTKYVFAVKAEGIPPTASYRWYSKDGGNLGNQNFAEIWADSAGQYTIYVEAVWTADKGQKKVVSQPLTFNIAAAPKVTIIPPPDITAGKGVTGKRYVFVASTKSVPAGAVYTWIMNGQQVSQGLDDPEAVAPPDFFKAGSYTMAVAVTWKDKYQNNQQVTDTISFKISGGAPAPVPTPTPAPTPGPTLPPTPSADKEEVTFAVYRVLTTTFPDKTVTKTKQFCQNFLVKIYKVEGTKEIFIDPGVQGGFSIGRNGSYERILPVGHYKYIVSGTYTNPDGTASGTAGFDVVKGGRNFVEVVDYATYNPK